MKFRILYLITAALVSGCNSTEEFSSFSPATTISQTSVTPSTPNPNPHPIYKDFDSIFGTSAVEGDAIDDNTTDNLISYVTVSGSINHRTGRVEIIGPYNMVDADGFDPSDQATDGTQILKLLAYSNDYDHARAYTATRTVGGKSFRTFGVLGIPTRSENLPISGTATYSGHSDVLYENIPGTYTHSSVGTVQIDADFGNGSVDVTSTFADVRDASLNTPVADPDFDEIRLRGMTITAGQFNGGTYELLKNGTTVDPVGAGAFHNTNGRFYGGEAVDSSTRPAEAGGVFSVHGADANIYNTFVGD